MRLLRLIRCLDGFCKVQYEAALIGVKTMRESLFGVAGRRQIFHVSYRLPSGGQFGQRVSEYGFGTDES